MKGYVLPSVQFAFSNEANRSDKLRGLVEFGPYRPLHQSPTFGFVFPTEYRDNANELFLALKNGVGAFKGVETTFRFPLSKDQVFQISDFSIRGKAHHDAARLYEQAILEWNARANGQIPDLFFVIHPQTSISEPDTPYYATKARLLTEGILSQSVTKDLISDDAKFRWSAANIALGAFVKLGGIPWIVSGKELESELIIGIGRSYLFDVNSRQTRGYMGFTACFSARGLFEFLALADVTPDRAQYIALLGGIVSESLQRAEKIGRKVSSVTLHVPKEMSREELDVIHNAVRAHSKQNILQIVIVKISEEETFFAVDTRFKDGIPKRGTVIQVSDRDYLLYTEGRDEKESWANFRLPVALRVTPQGGSNHSGGVKAVIGRINDLSQVNWRGFNARSKPISTYYGTLIAQLLCHIPIDRMKALSSNQTLSKRLWFI